MLEVRKLDHAMRKERLMQIYAALKEKGYNPVGQIVGYILSEDPTYITNHAGARQMIARIDREENECCIEDAGVRLLPLFA